MDYSQARPPLLAGTRCASRRPKFGLVQRNAPVEQVATVGVTVAQGDAEQTWRYQRAVHGDNRERHRQAIVGTQSGDRDAMRHGIIGHRIDLRGMKISSRARITEILALRLLIAIVLVEAEAGFASPAAGLVAVPIGLVARRRLRWLRKRVVAAGAIDLERNIVRLGLRVRRGARLVCRGEAVAADFLEQAR